MKSAFTFLISASLLVAFGGCRSRPTSTPTPAQQSNVELLNIAEHNYRQGRLDLAEADLRRVLKTDARNNEAHYYLHKVKEERSKTQLAQERLNRERDGLWYPTLPPKEVH